MALFTVPHLTVGFFGNAGLKALAESLERDTRTVKRVRIPVHGVTRKLWASLRQPAPSVGAARNGAPKRHLHSAPRRVCGRRPADTRPWALRAATQGMQARLSAAGEQAPTDAIPSCWREMRHCSLQGQ